MKVKKANLCGKQVKLARIIKDMHQIDLAAALSVDFNIEMNQSMISAIERGTRKVSDVELDAFSVILEKPITWLLYGEKLRDNITT
jgi:transcriptional regulator with XRE-family HTH domain